MYTESAWDLEPKNSAKISFLNDLEKRNENLKKCLDIYTQKNITMVRKIAKGFV